MEEKRISLPHKLSIQNRQGAEITGVLHVVSFDEKLVVLATQCGVLTVKGEELHVERLDLEKGELEFCGRIDNILYKEEGGLRSKPKESIMERLFK